MYSVLDSDEIGMSYSGDCEEKGFHLMGFLDLGTRHIMTTQKTINSIEFKEPQDPDHGKSGTAGFLYRIRRKARCRWHTANYTQALQQNIIDGAEAAIQTIIPRSFMRQRRTGQWLDGPTT